ncbi:hypothetical protein HWI79_2078 [Cryptosporidium felis]|nr:hypothetical protein HWI79_2078 [Cryptosporidium felis]
MKTAFQGDLGLVDKYYEGPPQQSPKLSFSEISGSGFKLEDLFRVTSYISTATFDHSLFGLTNARAALATSFFVGFGSFIALILIIAGIRGAYLVSRKRSNRSGYNDLASAQRFVIRSSDEIEESNFSKEFPSISKSQV